MKKRQENGFSWSGFIKPIGLIRGSLEDLYNRIENSSPQLKYCYFQGIKYKTGSKTLKKALDKWYEQNAKR